MAPTAFLALVAQCAPGAPAETLAAIARGASGYEPLALAIHDGRRAVTLQATAKPEAVALATEAVLAGHRVRIGLTGLDARDLDGLGVTLGDAFDPCTNLAAAARLVRERPDRRLNALDPPPERSHDAQAPTREHRRPGQRGVGPPAPPSGSPPAWDVYGQAKGSGVLIYGP